MPETQAKSSWTPPTGVLGRIVAEAYERSAALRAETNRWRAEAEAAVAGPSLAAALRGAAEQRGVLGVIAEVKRRSPSKGAIRADIDAPTQARAYVAGGALAISVLTEPAHFDGSIEDLSTVAQAVSVPALKKDFHVEPVQLYQARACGAAAALLIVRALEPVRLRELLGVAGDIGLETIVEVHDEAELEIALDVGAEIIGVNNRNLETLHIDSNTALRLIPGIPVDRIAIAESGMQSADDVARVAEAGADAVLVGTAVSAAEDPVAAVAALAAVRARRDVRSR